MLQARITCFDYLDGGMEGLDGRGESGGLLRRRIKVNKTEAWKRAVDTAKHSAHIIVTLWGSSTESFVSDRATNPSRPSSLCGGPRTSRLNIASKMVFNLRATGSVQPQTADHENDASD